MKLLEGTKIRVKRENRDSEIVCESNKEKGREMEKNNLEITEEDIGIAIDRMKNKKVPGIDHIPMEAWRYGGTAIRKGLIKLIKKIWKGDSIPEDWETSVVLPLYKKGDQEKTENYRGHIIALFCIQDLRRNRN